MKKLIFTLSASLFALGSYAQWNPVNDSIEMGATYLNNVYYSLLNGEVSTAPTNNWHLAFRTGMQTDGIRINSATASGPNDGSVKLYLFAKGDTSKWTTFDTAGYLTWNTYDNRDTTWEIGAFNAHAGTFPDVSWGTYDFSTHEVNGDAIYLITYKNLGTTVFKKVWIMSKKAGDWKFRFADIDGGNQKEIELKNADHNSKNFVYYNLATEQVVTQEPDSKDWDFVLTRYNALQSNATYAAATGILTNVGVKTAKATGEGVGSMELSEYIADTNVKINEIGYDWKYYEIVGPGGIWKTRDSLAYFVKDKNGVFWKLVFTSFGGAADGKTVFTKQQLTPGVSVPELSPINSSSVYPNPTNTSVNVLFDVNSDVQAQLTLLTIDGSAVLFRTVDGFSGLNTTELDLSGLNSGIYFLQIRAEGYQATFKVVKN